MKIDNVNVPKSSFLSMEKDVNIIVNKIYDNERLKRLLYYTTNDALKRPNLNEEQTGELFGKNIKLIPKLSIDHSVLNYIIISFDNFVESSNPQFRDNIIEFDIVCHYDQWELEDFSLRPYKIAGELDQMFNGAKLTGIGTLNFLGANQMILTDEFAGICLMYQAVHGGEDKTKMPNPADEDRFIQDYEDFID